jgi:geranylgeranyl diphosphate synthase, type I
MYERSDELTDSELVDAAVLVESAGGREVSQAQADALLASALGELSSAEAVAPAAAELEKLARLATRRDH